jgi:cell division protein FtsQ
VRLIDSNGVAITDDARAMARFAHLPLVVGEGAQNAARGLVMMLAAEPEIMKRIEAAIFVGGRRWDLKMKNNVTVRLPEADMGLSLRRLAEAQGADKLLEQDLESIDLREAGRLIVRTRPGMVQDYQASFKQGSAI